ncbi:MAG TPA: exonuclease domain-containing protein [Methylomirabilota bacterium]|nr:exonuclease domain-containing protein [Methylomirabilota bacterium]
MGEKPGLRLRIFLFFGLIATGSVAAMMAAVLVAARHAPPETIPDLVLAFAVAAFPTVALTLWVWLKFDETVARPILTLAAEIQAALHAGARGALAPETGRFIEPLASTARAVIDTLAAHRERTDEAVAAAVADAARQRGRLEAVLRDIEEGVVICNLDHRIRLYNRHALQILHVSGDLGLGRSLLSVVSPQPIRHSLQRLVRRFESGRHVDHPDGLTALVIVTTLDRRRQLRGRMVLTLEQEGTKAAGYIISFGDVTNELSAGVWRDRLLHEATEDMRQRVSNLALAGEVLIGRLPPGDRRTDALRHVFVEEPAALGLRLDQLDGAASDLLASAWPMANVLSTSLLTMVRERRSEGRDLDVEIEGGSLWLHCDGATVVDLLDRMMNRIAIYARTPTFRLGTGRGERLAFLDIKWRGDGVPLDVLTVWLEERLDDALGPITGADVLKRHHSDVWCQEGGDGWTVLRMPLAIVETREGRPIAQLPERPEFYDFDLSAAVDRLAIVDAPLKALTLVVFDTETTGLEPSRGDEIIQIAGVRIVNGRLLRGEVFDSYVDPGRRIPSASTKVHGISDDMVSGADSIERVLPRFHAFVGDAVLVAHNAAFDMKFLSRGAGTAGVAFDTPVLDTVLLAAHLFGATTSLTLDSLAERFQIVIPTEDRHTALGDSIATALVLIRLIDMLDAAGVTTLRDALAVSERQVSIRRAQKAY